MVLQFNISSSQSSKKEEVKEDDPSAKYRGFKKDVDISLLKTSRPGSLNSYTDRDYPDAMERATPLPSDQICFPHPKIITEILKQVRKDVTVKRCLEIPLFYLYSSQSIYPEYLKNIDSELFTIFLKEGYSLMLSPVELMTNRNDIFEIRGEDFDEV
jgi:hypothetical protein